MTDKEKATLLVEAQRRYPIGTVYYTAHLNDEKCTISTTNFEVTSTGIYESSGNKKKNRHSYSEILKEGDKWAKIISYPPGYIKNKLYKIH